MSANQQRAADFAAKTELLDENAFLKAAVEEFSGDLLFATSLGAEDQVLLHLLKDHPSVEIFTLDTGRLPQETYDVLDASVKRYSRSIEILFPEAQAVREMVNAKGINLFYESVENRKACCHVRKVRPLDAKLRGRAAWITGLRRQQSQTRTNLARVEYDAGHDMVKLNPLIEWSREDVWEYIHSHKIPYNVLHDQGYPSIGCDPCTRAVQPGEDERAGRWWWELPEHKECGIHVGPVKKTFQFKTM